MAFRKNAVTAKVVRVPSRSPGVLAAVTLRVELGAPVLGLNQSTIVAMRGYRAGGRGDKWGGGVIEWSSAAASPTAADPAPAATCSRAGLHAAVVPRGARGWEGLGQRCPEPHGRGVRPCRRIDTRSERSETRDRGRRTIAIY